MSIAVSPARIVLTFGSQGSTVRQLQHSLNLRFHGFGIASQMSVAVDSRFGHETLMAVKYLQCVGGLPVDGRVDQATWQFVLEGVNGLPVLSIGSRRTCVMAMQQSMVAAGILIDTDGRFGPQTVQAVQAYQRKMGLVPSGIVDADTWEVIVRSRLTSLPCATLLPNPYQGC